MKPNNNAKNKANNKLQKRTITPITMYITSCRAPRIYGFCIIRFREGREIA